MYLIVIIIYCIIYCLLNFCIDLYDSYGRFISLDNYR